MNDCRLLDNILNMCAGEEDIQNDFKLVDVITDCRLVNNFLNYCRGVSS